jgi:methionine synthase II (cobalamin-independent)
MRADYRAEVIGSLLRPAYLKEARARHAAGTVGDAELKRVEDRAVDEAVGLQTRVGVSVITDGEMRRYAYFGHFIVRSKGSTSSAAGRFRSATSRATSSSSSVPSWCHA